MCDLSHHDGEFKLVVSVPAGEMLRYALVLACQNSHIFTVLRCDILGISVAPRTQHCDLPLCVFRYATRAEMNKYNFGCVLRLCRIRVPRGAATLFAFHPDFIDACSAVCNVECLHERVLIDCSRSSACPDVKPSGENESTITLRLPTEVLLEALNIRSKGNKTKREHPYVKRVLGKRRAEDAFYELPAPSLTPRGAIVGHVQAHALDQPLVSLAVREKFAAFGVVRWLQLVVCGPLSERSAAPSAASTPRVRASISSLCFSLKQARVLVTEIAANRRGRALVAQPARGGRAPLAEARVLAAEFAVGWPLPRRDLIFVRVCTVGVAVARRAVAGAAAAANHRAEQRECVRVRPRVGRRGPRARCLRLPTRRLARRLARHPAAEHLHAPAVLPAAAPARLHRRRLPGGASAPQRAIVRTGLQPHVACGTCVELLWGIRRRKCFDAPVAV